MAILDYLLPWVRVRKLRGDLRTAQREHARLRKHIVNLENRKHELAAQLLKCETNCSGRDARIKFQRDEIQRLNALIAKQPHHDPKTGRFTKATPGEPA